MGILTTILAFLVAIGVLIVVHELGHYSVARWCGVKVLRFSLGFGRPIARWTLGPDRTEWVIAAFPYGGYVRMLDERETDGEPIDPGDLPRAFNRQSLARRAAIVVAGPAANLLLAIGIYFVMNLIGVTDGRARVASPAAGTPAAAAGLREGDLVLQVDGEAIRSWKGLGWELMRKALDHARAELQVRGADGGERRVLLDLSALDTDHVDGDLFAQIGVAPPNPEPIVRTMNDRHPAQLAGMQIGDRIVRIGDVPIAKVDDIQRTVGASAGKPLQFQVERGTASLRLDITPVAEAGPDGVPVGRIGVGFGETIQVADAPWPALRHAVARTWDTSALSLRILGRMIVGRASLKNLSGPVTIAGAAGQSARHGLMTFLGYLALVSISLGVMNLLPVPVLDGGHLLYYAIEVLKGSPLSASWLELGQRVGIGLLVVLTALALYNDLTRLLFQ
jgi:regulator of sigma E protease